MSNNRTLRLLPFFHSHPLGTMPEVANNEDGPNANAQQNAQILRVNDFMPQRFDGQTLSDAPAHILSFEDYCQLQNIKEDVPRVQRFRVTLSGQARLWVEGKEFATWDILKKSFLQYHSDSHTRESAVASFRSSSYKHGETAEQYLQRLKRLAERLEYGNDMVKDQYISGLPAEAKTAVAMARPANLAECVELAQQFLDLNKQKEVSFNLQAHSIENVGLQQPQQSHLLAAISSLSDSVNKLNLNRGRSRSIERKPRENQKHTSNFRGASSDRNPNPRNQNGQRSNSFRGRSSQREQRSCYFCKKQGHLIKDCRKRQRQPNRSGRYHSMQEDVTLQAAKTLLTMQGMMGINGMTPYGQPQPQPQPQPQEHLFQYQGH